MVGVVMVAVVTVEAERAVATVAAREVEAKVAGSAAAETAVD
jgi:hypothetical protein